MILAIVNQKGGVGKTTLTVNLGAEIARRGKKVLLIDADAQANLTDNVIGEPPEDLPTLYNMLLGEATAEETILHGELVDLIPADISLSVADLTLASALGRETLLKRALEPIRDDYDYIFIDCAPTLGLLTIICLTAADAVLVPMQTQRHAVQGVQLLLDSVMKIKESVNPSLYIAGVIVTLYQKQRRQDQDKMETLQKAFGDTLYKTYITQSVSIAEATDAHLDVGAYDPHGKAAKQYMTLTDEFLERMEGYTWQRSTRKETI